MAPWVATQHAPRAQNPAFDDAAFLDSFMSVCGAGGIEFAIAVWIFPAQQHPVVGRQGFLVKADEKEDRCAHGFRAVVLYEKATPCRFVYREMSLRYFGVSSLS